MRDWMAIVLIALVTLAVIAWAMRRRSGSGAGAAAREPPTERTVPKITGRAAQAARVSVPRKGQDPDVGTPLPAAAKEVPNTTIPPNPEDMPLAMLDFDGPPGCIPVHRGETVIGRHSNDDVRLNDVRVSRHHARLVARGGGGFEIHNLTAARPQPNAMLINGEARDHAHISAGDTITLGGVRFTLRAADAH